jgi:hypothetical protein
MLMDYKKANRRKAPTTTSLNNIRQWGNLVMGLVLIVMGTIFTNTADILSGVLWLATAMIGLGAAVSAGYSMLRLGIYRRKLKRDEATGTATLVDAWQESKKNWRSSMDTCHVAFEFEPIEASASTGKLTLRGEVEPKLWSKLRKGQELQVYYAREEPRIVRLEGE